MGLGLPLVNKSFHQSAVISSALKCPVYNLQTIQSVIIERPRFVQQEIKIFLYVYNEN